MANVEQQRQDPEQKRFEGNPLLRSETENREPVPTREGARSTVEGQTNRNQLATGLTANPGDNAEAQNAKNRLVRKKCEALKKLGAPHLAEAARNAQLAINDTLILPLQQEWKRVFQPEQQTDGISVTTRTEYRNAFGNPIKSMLSGASEDIVMISGGRVCNRVGHAAGYMRELDIMLKDPLLKESITDNPQIKQQIRRTREYVISVRRFFKGVLDGDPVWRDTMKTLRPERKVSGAMRNGKMAMHMLALLGASGMALICGLIDIKNKKLSPYTLAWLGLAGYTSGAFRGRHATITEQLRFLPDAKWEALGITGEEGRRLIDRVNRNTKKSRDARRKLLKGESTPQQYIEMIMGKDPQGDDLATAKHLRTIAAKGPEAFTYMVRSITGVTDRSAKILFKDMIGSGTNSGTVGAAIGKPVSTK